MCGFILDIGDMSRGHTRYVYASDILGTITVFFFKQKTAYEMRISDWSSDVCSSDLIALAVITPRQPPVAIERPRRVRNPERHRSLEIGRASCRERVCQYV